MSQPLSRYFMSILLLLFLEVCLMTSSISGSRNSLTGRRNFSVLVHLVFLGERVYCCGNNIGLLKTKSSV